MQPRRPLDRQRLGRFVFRVNRRFVYGRHGRYYSPGLRRRVSSSLQVLQRFRCAGGSYSEYLVLNNAVVPALLLKSRKCHQFYRHAAHFNHVLRTHHKNREIQSAPSLSLCHRLSSLQLSRVQQRAPILVLIKQQQQNQNQKGGAAEKPIEQTNAGFKSGGRNANGNVPHLLCAGTARMTIEKALNMKVMSMMTLPCGSG